MPLQNRVTPTGDIIATPHRGLFTGNRGIIHDPATKTLVEKALVEPGLDHLRLRIPGLAAQGDGRGEAGPNCSFSTRRPRSRPATGPVSSAAATMPTVFARRGRRAMALRTFARARWMPCCIGERLERGKKRLHPLPMPVSAIARWRDGAAGRGEFSDPAGQGAAMVDGWLSARRTAALDDAMLLTPPSTLRALGAGYRPVLHPSACS